MGLMPGQGTKIPYAVELLSLSAAITEPMCPSYRAHVLQRKIPHGARKILHATAKTPWQSQKKKKNKSWVEFLNAEIDLNVGLL